MAEDPAFDFGSHSVPVDRNEAIAKGPPKIIFSHQAVNGKELQGFT
jgi:hypothetical protein